MTRQTLDLPTMPPLPFVNKFFLRPIEGLGRYFRFLGKALWYSKDLQRDLLFQQLEFVGNKSLMIIVLAGSMIGGIFGFQLGEIFKLFKAESMMGAASAYTLSRELAPVIGAMLVTGRAGSAMAAEIGIMRVKEQIDALSIMAIHPLAYLVTPRILASVLMLPLLTMIFIASGLTTSYLVGSEFYDVDVGRFFDNLTRIVDWKDLFQGLQKAVVFAVLFSSISCYFGFYTRGGAKGVGQAATISVVVSFVAILLVNFVISYIHFKFL